MTEPIARRVDHVSFAVRDLDRSLHFYCNVLGLARAALAGERGGGHDGPHTCAITAAASERA